MSRAEARPGTIGDNGFDRKAEVALHASRTEQPTAGIVHDLGNLIQVASSALNRVARDPSVSMAPALEPVIASARTALQRAGALVRDTMGRALEAPKEIEHTDLSSCLAEVETLIRSAWELQIRLEVRVGSDLPPAICDRLGLQNAVLNLVFNARDAMPEGGSISIDAALADKGHGALVELRVADTGIGMTQETMARAFDPFFTTKCQGLGGIGLPMVKHFAEQYDGSVEIDSALGSGTTVILRLPAAPARADGRPQLQPNS
ncbi:sensor histidine kinase [Mesorhizobium sophorae]|uniref:sensor histidine kinase n=1 Tax=Mesorhizobium sophorae TaxID=1300294 RepID=UPI001FD95718|nr:ATP-binding protein [Mesorhizobium sophorae]